MRFAFVLAAMAALWVQPAKATVQIVLPLTPEAGTHWKISLTGLTAEDRIFAAASIPTLNWYFWLNPTTLYEDHAFPLDCSVETGYPTCGADYAFVSPTRPVKANFRLNLSLVGSDISFDYTMFAQDICASIPTAERTGNNSDICGYRWGDVPGSFSFDVGGPSSQTFGYTITDISPNPAPEPATWTLMILGIGLAGAAMRKHRVPSYARRTTRALAA